MGYAALPHQHGEGRETDRIREALERVERFQTVAEVFRQLGDTTRIRIFWLLCHCEECVINIAAMLEMSSPAVSHHLRPLRSSGLIVSRREGKEVYYQASDTPQSRLLHQMIEEVMEITCPEGWEEPDEQPLHPDGPEGGDRAPEYRQEHVAIVREIHRQLLDHMDRRVTIEELARQYHINPTTLKTVFKAVYGKPLAAHVKEHRMEQAAALLRGTERSVAEIARSVGYDSQSRFAAAFKEVFHVLPTAYRKQNQGM